MNILILNGDPSGKGGLDGYIRALSGGLSRRGCAVTVMPLREMDVRHCTGCWSCWWRTPGLCMHDDDMPRVYRAALEADLLFFASPLVAGFVSALTKRANERLIPLLHPYLNIIGGECHHRGRYDRYPDLGLLLEKGPGGDDEDVAITGEIYRRDAINFRSGLRHVIVTTTPVEEACREIAGP